MVMAGCARALLTLALAVAAAAIAAASPSGAAPPPTPTAVAGPPLGLSEAVAIAEKWVSDRGVDVSGQYISSVRICYDEGPERKGRYWHVQWAWAMPRLGGEFGARVYMDGTVIPQRCGP
jgi:hypothetical protein